MLICYAVLAEGTWCPLSIDQLTVPHCAMEPAVQH